ncbi:MAG: histone H1 [Paludibacteraceae bacterium]|nr:histone H1 [Paludibacteraceae bacterium]
MKKLATTIEEKMQFFAENAKAQVENGNKAAGMRARKASLELEKLLKEFRKQSIEAAK